MRRALAAVLCMSLVLTVPALAGCDLLRGMRGEGDSSDGNGRADGDEEEVDPFATLLAHLSDEPFVYVAVYGESGHTVQVDSETDQVVGECGAGGFISELALRPDGSLLYASAPTKDKVLVMDPFTGQVVKEMDVADGPVSIAFTPDGDRYLVAHMDADYVTVHDAATDDETSRITVGEFPARVRVDFRGTKAYVGHGSAAPGMDEMPTAEEIQEMVFSGELGADPSAFEEVFQVEQGAREIAVLDLASMSRSGSIETQGNGLGLTWRPDGKVAYATSFSSDYGSAEEILADPENLGDPELLVIDAESDVVVKSLDVNAQDVAYTPDGSKVYALCSDKVVVIDGQAHEVLSEIPIDLGG